jgi:hypothetical protein
MQEQDQRISLPTEELERELVTATGEAFTVAQLRDRVSLIEPRIVVMREVDLGSPEMLDVMGARIEELTRGLAAYGLVIDLAASTGKITTEYRKYVPIYFSGLHERSQGALKLMSVAFYGNPVARIVTKFLVGRMLEVPITVENSLTQAVQAVRKALR